MASAATIMELFEKLAHPLAEVRRRALRSLLFKQQHGLLAAADVGAALPHVIAGLDLSCAAAAAGDPADALATLQLLHSLIGSGQGGEAAAKAMQCSADQALIRLADTAPACTVPATALLGKLLCACGEAGQDCTATPCRQHRPGSGRAASASPATRHPALQAGRLPAAAALSPSLPPSPPLAPWSSPQCAASEASPPAGAASSNAWVAAPAGSCGSLDSLPRSAAAEALSEEDQQQLFEVALELGAEPGAVPADETALLATLATLRHGVLADMPAAAVAGEPALAASLLRLLEGGQARPRVAAAALGALQALAAKLGAAESATRAASPGAAGQREEGRDAGSAAALASAALLRCAQLCSDGFLRHAALPAAAAFVPLLAIPAGKLGAASKLMAPLLDALADALHLTLVAECTAADVPPPNDWAAGLHALVLGPGSCGILRLLVDLLGRAPQAATAQILPPTLCDILAALACSPVAAAAAPDLHAFGRRHLSSVHPAAAAQLETVADLQRQQAGLLAAVQQLVAAPSPALAAACCREVHQRLSALALLPGAACQKLVAQLVDVAGRHAAVSAAVNLAATLMLHFDPSVRQAALEAVGRLERSAATALLCCQPVAGSLVLALGDAAPRQQLAASLLQAVAAAAPEQSGQAFQPWETWLHCHAGQAAGGPAVAAVLQSVTGQKRSTWQHLAPLVLALFHTNPAAANAAASELHSLLVQQRPAAAGTMLFCPLPFDGLLLPAGSAASPAACSGMRERKAASANAAKLFTAADVQSLLAVAGNPGLPGELAAAALGQLAQVAGDARFAAILGSEQVLGMLLGHALDASPLFRVQQPALECIVALLEQQPAAPDWLLGEAEGRLVPLLPLVFHLLPAAREAVARLLHHLLFVAAARQLDSLVAGVQASEGSGSSSTRSRLLAGRGVPEPFCATFCFPVPAAVLPVWPAAQQMAGSSSSIFDAFGSSEPVQRLWRAQQICEAAADGSADSGSLLELLASHSAASLPRWQLDFVRASLATLKNLQPDAAAGEVLAALAGSQDHAQCHTALHRLALLATPAAMPEGLAALAAAPWLNSLRFLLAAAPLSPEDCFLWMELLPLLTRLLEACSSQQRTGQQPLAPQLQEVAEQFVGGTALDWVRQQATQAQPLHVQAALLPEVLHTVCRIVELGMLHGSGLQRQQLVAAMRSFEWLGLLGKQLAAGSYASRVAALRLAAALVGGQASCPPTGLQAGQLFTAAVRQVLMPRHLWGTLHHHGKAAVLSALELLHVLTQAAPAEDWAAAWAELGTTYWLSRAAADSSPAVRTTAMRLLAAALAVAATHALLQAAWPECGATMIEAALASDEEPVATRAAALSAVAVVLAHGPLHPAPAIQSGGAAAAASAAMEAEVAMPPTGMDGQASAAPATQRGAAAEPSVQESSAAADSASMASGGAASGACTAEGSMQLALLPSPAVQLSAETFLQQAKLWDGVHLVLQEASDPCLLSAAAHAALQQTLLDADGAGSAADSAVLLRLLGLPSAAAAGLLEPEPTGCRRWHCLDSAMLHAVQAARAAASILVVRCRLGGSSSADVLPAAAAAFSTVVATSSASLPELPTAAADAVRLACWAALPVLADAVALLMQCSAPLASAEAQAACSCQPQPLVVAVAAALTGPPSEAGSAGRCSPALSASFCRMLAALLQQEGTACAFLLAGPGQERAVPVESGSTTDTAPSQPVGAALCTHLMEFFVEAAAAEAAAAAETGAQDASPQSKQQQVVVLLAALGGLLAHSQSAKQVALDVGFHGSLLATCRSLAATSSSAAPAAPAQQALSPPQPPSSSRTSKLQQLKQRRSGGTAQLAFGSRAPSSRTDSREMPLKTKQQQPAAPAAAALEASAAPAVPPASSAPSPGSALLNSKEQHRLLQLLALLQQLVAGSAAACDAVGTAGLLGLAGALLQPWEAGSPAGGGAAQVLHSMLRLLGSVLTSSQATRHTCASDGEPVLLERLVALLLSARTPLPTAYAVAAALCSFAGTPDGAHTLVHSVSLPARALRHLQDGMAAKDWRRLGPVLQLLAGLCSQPEGQRAVLRCSAPSGDLLGALLALAVPGSSAQVPATGGAAAAGAAEPAMLAIRQLALHPEAKAHLVGGRHGALQSLVDAVGAASAGSHGQGAAQLQRAAAAAHALWALVHGSGGERAKAALRRCQGWEDSLREGLAAADREPQACWAAALKEACTALRRLLA
ncbi:hypothetical protein ABPG75_003184 [Micractinium tetrahymenae]